MTVTASNRQQTDETTNVEKVFRDAGFPDVSAYRHSSASIRVRVRDERFRKLSRVARMDFLDPVIEHLPEETQQDLIFVLPMAPGEEHSGEFKIMNLEFEEPRPVSY